MSFSSKSQIEKKTGKNGLGRFQYLQALVNEYQKTQSKGTDKHRNKFIY